MNNSMANLYNNRENKNSEGFNPYVDNTERSAKSSTAATIIFWIVGLIIFSGIYFLVKRNSYLRQQNHINEAASTIDVQLAKRSDTLVKLFDVVQSHKQFEKDTFSEIARLRTFRSSTNLTSSQRSELEGLNSSVFGRLMAVSENYPELKASQSYKELTEQIIYLEREIAAARRLYNSSVTQFNSSIFTWPGSVIAAALKLSTFALFAASSRQREDVSMKGL